MYYWMLTKPDTDKNSYLRVTLALSLSLKKKKNKTHSFSLLKEISNLI